jgi:hypothetical protein
VGRGGDGPGGLQFSTSIHPSYSQDKAIVLGCIKRDSIKYIKRRPSGLIRWVFHLRSVLSLLTWRNHGPKGSIDHHLHHPQQEQEEFINIQRRSIKSKIQGSSVIVMRFGMSRDCYQLPYINQHLEIILDFWYFNQMSAVLISRTFSTICHTTASNWFYNNQVRIALEILSKLVLSSLEKGGSFVTGIWNDRPFDDNLISSPMGI